MTVCTPLLRLLVVAAVLGLAACGGLAPEAPPPTQTPTRKPAEPPGETAPAAVRTLAGQAEQASAGGEHDRAAALLERALRIEPRNAVLWQNLAVVRFRQGRDEEAENLAQRSNSLAGGNTELQRGNWSLIAAARERRGDAAGADEARARQRALAGGGAE